MKSENTNGIQKKRRKKKYYVNLRKKDSSLHASPGRQILPEFCRNSPNAAVLRFRHGSSHGSVTVPSRFRHGSGRPSPLHQLSRAGTLAHAASRSLAGRSAPRLLRRRHGVLLHERLDLGLVPHYGFRITICKE